MSKLHGLIDGDIVLYECIAGKDDEVLAGLCHAIKKRIEALVEDCGVNTYDIFLSGPREVNYRYEVYPEYKAKRPPKPAHLAAAKQYMFDELWAIEGTFGENDDQMGIAGYTAYRSAMQAWQEDGSPEGKEQFYSSVVLMTTDKDLKMIPGWHYSWSPNSDHQWKWTTLDKGYEWFFTQMLTGDSTDGIPGLKGVGPKAAEKVMAASETNIDRLKNVVSSYVKKSEYRLAAIAKAKEHGTLDEKLEEKLGAHIDLEYFLTMADLLWIQRNEWIGRQFIRQLAEKKGFDLEGVEWPQPEPEPEPSVVREEVNVATKSVFASTRVKNAKTQEAFAARSKPHPESPAAKIGLGLVTPEDVEKAKDVELDPDKAEADLKSGLEGMQPGDETPLGAKAVEIPVDHNPDVKRYPDGTEFEFDDSLPF